MLEALGREGRWIDRARPQAEYDTDVDARLRTSIAEGWKGRAWVAVYYDGPIDGAIPGPSATMKLTPTPRLRRKFDESVIDHVERFV